MLSTMLSQFSPEAGMFFGIAFSVLTLLLVVVALALVGRVRLPQRSRHRRVEEPRKKSSRVRVEQPKKAKSSWRTRPKTRDDEQVTDDTPAPAFARKPSAPPAGNFSPLDSAPVPGLASATAANGVGVSPPDPGASVPDGAGIQLEELPDLPLPGAAGSPDQATGSVEEQTAVDELEGEEEEQGQSENRGSSVFDVFTEAAVEETDTSRFAKTLKSVRIEDILAEVEEVRGQMSRRV